MEERKEDESSLAECSPTVAAVGPCYIEILWSAESQRTGEGLEGMTEQGQQEELWGNWVCTKNILLQFLSMFNLFKNTHIINKYGPFVEKDWMN